MPRCKNCKEKFNPSHFNQKYCMQDVCIKVWVDEVRTQNTKKQKQEFRKKESESLPFLKRQARLHFHKWIRNRDKNSGCISCGIPLTTKFDAGHFWNSNNHSAVRFSEHNVNGQCVSCNQHKHGNLLEYQIRLKEKIGIHHYELLEKERHKHKQYTAQDYKDIILRYKH